MKISLAKSYSVLQSRLTKKKKKKYAEQVKLSL